MFFDVQMHQQDEWVVVSVVGEVDLATAPRLRQTVIEAVASTPGAAPSLVLDLGSVDFIDSSGLGVVLGALKRVRAAQGRLRVVVREPQVQRVFELTDLDRVVCLTTSVDEAMALADAESDRTVRGG